MTSIQFLRSRQTSKNEGELGKRKGRVVKLQEKPAKTKTKKSQENVKLRSKLSSKQQRVMLQWMGIAIPTSGSNPGWGNWLLLTPPKVISCVWESAKWKDTPGVSMKISISKVKCLFQLQLVWLFWHVWSSSSIQCWTCANLASANTSSFTPFCHPVQSLCG